MATTNTVFNIWDLDGGTSNPTSTVSVVPARGAVNVLPNASQTYTFVISQTATAGGEATINTTSNLVLLPDTTVTGITLGDATKELQIDDSGDVYLAATDVDISITRIRGSYDTNPVAVGDYPQNLYEMKFSTELSEIIFSGDLPNHIVVDITINPKVDLTNGDTYDFVFQDTIAETISWDFVSSFSSGEPEE